MKLLLAALLAAAAPVAAQAADIDFRDMVAKVRIVPENRGDVVVQVVKSRSDLPPIRITRTASGVVVDGGLHRRIQNCGGMFGISIKDGPTFSRKNMPQIVVHAPPDVVVHASGMVDGEVGSLRRVKLDNQGCGDWTIGDVSDQLTIDFQGMGNVKAGRARSVDLSLQGMGHIDVASVNGPAKVSVQGLGGVAIHGGHAADMRAELDGMGHISFDGVAESLDATADGMGMIRVNEVKGPVRRSQNGFATIKIGR